MASAQPPDSPDPGEPAFRGFPELIIEFGLFLSAYALLFAMLAVRFEPVWLTIACGTLAAAGFGFGFVLIRQFRRVSTYPWKLRAVEDQGAEIAGFLATYLLPLLTVTEPSTRDLIAYVAFLAVTAVIYMRSGLVRINPTLFLLGWGLHKVTIGPTAWTGYVLSRDALAVGDELDATRITERIFLNE